MGVRRGTLTPFCILLPLLGVVGCDFLFGPDGPEAIEIRASRQQLSMVGDTVLLTAAVRDADGKALPDAAVTWESRVPGVVAVDPTGTLTALANGTAWVLARSGRAQDSVEFTVKSPVRCLPVGDLALPGTVRGELGSTDCAVTGGPLDAWWLTLDEAEEVTIDLESDDFDAYLLVTDSSGTVLRSDEDGGDGSNARIFWPLPAGRNVVYVAAYGVQETGSYTLSVIRGAHPPPCPATSMVAWPDSIAGTLSAQSCNYNGYYVEVRRVNVPADTVISAVVRTEGFAPDLAITDTLGEVIATGRNTGQRLDAAWTEAWVRAGAYDVWLGAASQQQREGAFSLTVAPGPASARCARQGVLTAGVPARGDLTADDCHLFIGPAEGWDLDLADIGSFSVWVESDSIDPVIVVANPAGIPELGVVDGARYAGAHLGAWFPHVQVFVISGSGRPGSYTVTFQRGVALPSCEATGQLTPGSSADGTLEESDCVMPGLGVTDLWTVRFDTTTSAEARLSSSALHALLYVADSTGVVVAEGQLVGDGATAAVTRTFLPGTWQLWATSLGVPATGPYHIAVRSATGASESGAPALVPLTANKRPVLLPWQGSGSPGRM